MFAPLDEAILKRAAAIVHSVPTLAPRDGGLAYAVPALAGAMESQGHWVRLLAPRVRAGWIGAHFPTDVREVGGGWPRRFRGLRKALSEAQQCSDEIVIHDHGIWTALNHAVAGAATKAGLLRVVSPHGMLEPWAMSWHAVRKWLAWRVYQRPDLHRADLLHATSVEEAEQLRKLGLMQPIAVVPNGVEVPAEPSRRWRGGQQLAMVLARLHPKKNLPGLIEAWRRIEPDGWDLIIAGAGAPRYEAHLRRLIEGDGVPTRIHLLGQVGAVERQRLLGRASLSVLPSYSENFGLAIAEALAAGVPVIATTGTPWQCLTEFRCGWWVGSDVASLSEALEAAVRSSPEELQAMGRRGRALVERRFTWPIVARQMAATYAWIRGAGNKPDWIL